MIEGLVQTSVPLNIALLSTQVAVLGAHYYWLRKDSKSHKERLNSHEKESDEYKREIDRRIDRIERENHQTALFVKEMHTDIKWIKDRLQDLPSK